jgi:16S rRNA processing protein RimM
MMEKIKIAKIVNTHGIRGDLKLKSYTDFEDFRFKKGHHLFIRYENQDIEMEVRSHRVHKGMDLVRFEDHLDINLVEKYKNCFVYDYKNDALLDEDEYYVSDLIGCEVYNNNELIGKVMDVQLYSHHDLLVVKGKDKDYKIPYVNAFVLNEDIENKRIDVNLIEGF